MGTAGGQPGIAQLRGSTVARGHCAFYAVRGRLHDMNTITAYCCSPMGTAVGATLPLRWTRDAESQLRRRCSWTSNSLTQKGCPRVRQALRQPWDLRFSGDLLSDRPQQLHLLPCSARPAINRLDARGNYNI